MNTLEKIPTPTTDPRLLQKVRVRVLKPFCVSGKRLEIGAEVTIEFHVARDMKALGKVQIFQGLAT